MRESERNSEEQKMLEQKCCKNWKMNKGNESN